MAPPIVSQAYMRLTKFWSSNIFLTEKASESVTERGSPYGMATTITVIPIIKKCKRFTKSLPVSQFLSLILIAPNRISKTIMMTIAEYSPNLPISLAIFYNFCWRGVSVSSSFSKRALILPKHDWGPTTRIIILPSPVKTLVPLISIGDWIWCLFYLFYSWFCKTYFFFFPQNYKIFLVIGSVYPVIAL